MSWAQHSVQLAGSPHVILSARLHWCSLGHQGKERTNTLSPQLSNHYAHFTEIIGMRKRTCLWDTLDTLLVSDERLAAMAGTQQGSSGKRQFANFVHKVQINLHVLWVLADFLLSPGDVTWALRISFWVHCNLTSGQSLGGETSDAESAEHEKTECLCHHCSSMQGPSIWEGRTVYGHFAFWGRFLESFWGHDSCRRGLL